MNPSTSNVRGGRHKSVPKRKTNTIKPDQRSKSTNIIPKAQTSQSRNQKDQRRFRPGEKALNSIRKYNKVPGLLIRKLPFQRLVRQISGFLNKDEKVLWSSSAIQALQSVTEDYTINLIEDSYLCTLHGKRITLMSKDLHLARRIRGDDKFGLMTSETIGKSIPTYRTCI